jgi:ketopantoate reductase
MNILVYGVGVIGALYAVRLPQAEHRVAVLAQASRPADIRHHGLVLEDVNSEVISTSCLPTIQK